MPPREIRGGEGGTPTAKSVRAKKRLFQTIGNTVYQLMNMTIYTQSKMERALYVVKIILEKDCAWIIATQQGTYEDFFAIDAMLVLGCFLITRSC